ncbi:MAG TPA: hypothetical protein PK990_07650, partial [Salinivirgaceae bacterium]|nr:hypothetical protein [Salinivirgaceae bacterium]
ASIEKYDTQGTKIAVWNSPKQMEIHSFDVSNNFKIAVFFEQFDCLILLNQQLIEISPLFDLQQRMFDIVAVCNTSDGKFWVADGIQNTLSKLRENFSTEFSFTFSWHGNTNSIKKMKEFNQQLFIFLEDRWLILDLFGQKISELQLSGAEQVQLSYPKTLVVDNDLLIELDLSDFSIKELFPLNPGYKAAFRYKKNLYLFGEQSFEIVEAF